MALNVPDVGENAILEMIVNKTAAQNPVLKLYKNNITPSDTDTAGTYTEATFGGYAAVTLTGASWNSAASGSISYGSQQTITCNASATDDIYGYYIVQTTSGILLWSERDANAPFAVRNSGDAIKITPSLGAN
ncbi:MAG: hypothetical protein E6R04_10635 [Spirochaetes bacterium]|nr:MAG: hypothetical protein E6R04_10635 [Spirochaetota bacterium]